MTKIVLLGLLQIFFLGISTLNAQVETNNASLGQFILDQQSKSQIRNLVVDEYVKKHQISQTIITNDNYLQLYYIDEAGSPQYLITHNSVSAKSISTDQVYVNGGAGFDLSGNGVTIHQWDAGSVRATHQEFDSRVSNGDAKSVSWHSTHVAGTIMASGVNTNAKGMAFDADLIAFDWDEFNTEMAEEAALGALISNHSYGWLRGWEGGNTWWGDSLISDQEDYHFGFYDESAQIWDSIVYMAPNFLIVKSAGNDRNDKGDGTYPDDGPYDCIDQLGIAKNNLVVAAVNDIPGGYTQPSDVVMSNFSSWGPADDGRIKPDISANGTGLLSTDSGSDDDYRSASGTSMSAPSVAGSVALLQEHYFNLFGQYMTAATVKALIFQTADEAGVADGPDYEFGWGMMNTKNAALKISEADTNEVILEETLVDQDSLQFSFTATDTASIKITIAWTDPPGTPPEPSLDPADAMLINDLDLRVVDIENEIIYYPWKLDKDNPSLAATNDSENNIDNVEMVFIHSPDSGAIYTVTVDHDDILQSGSQDYSMVITYTGEMVLIPQTDFIADNTAPTLIDTVSLTDLSSNSPTDWEWSFDPNTVSFVLGSDQNSQHPNVSFYEPGLYHVTLTSTNISGSTTETKLDYIQVFEALAVEINALPDTICLGDSSQIISNISGGSGGYLYYWTSDPAGFFSNEQNPVVLIDTTTIFILELYDGYQTIIDSIAVNVNPLSEITLGDWPEELCNEDEPPVQLYAEPEGGFFTGNSVTPEGVFTPEEASLGWNILTYIFEDEHNCVSFAYDSIYVDNCVGWITSTIKSTDLKVYPNPNDDLFTIESKNQINKIEIINSLGKIIFVKNFSSKKVTVSHHLPKGIYVLKVKAGEIISYRSISVQ